MKFNRDHQSQCHGHIHLRLEYPGSLYDIYSFTTNSLGNYPVYKAKSAKAYVASWKFSFLGDAEIELKFTTTSLITEGKIKEN